MPARFRELTEQAWLANGLGYASITKGMHYSAAPWQDFQQFPFLCRIMAEAPDLRINFGLILLSLHKPLDIAEQIATADVMSGGGVKLRPPPAHHGGGVLYITSLTDETKGRLGGELLFGELVMA